MNESTTRDPSSKTPVTLPFLAGDHVSLLPITEAEIAVMLKGWNDPEVRHYARSLFPTTLESEKKWLADHPDINQKSDNFRLGIWLNNENRLIGDIGIGGISWVDSNCWFGLEIVDKTCWGKGHAGEAAALFLDYVFGELGMHKVIAGIFEPNCQSRAVAEKLGFLLIGMQKEEIFVDGKYIDSCIYEMFADAWRA